MKNIKLIGSVLIGLPYLIGLILYSKMPVYMATHWDAYGQPNGYMGRFWGVFLMPLIMLGIFLLLTFLPKLDPFRKNIDNFIKPFKVFCIVLYAFLLIVYINSFLWNLGYEINILRLLSIAFAVLYYSIGMFLPQTKRNFIIGIRTSWALMSDSVWEKTHAVGGKLFKVAAAITFFGVFSKDLAIYFVLVPVLAVSIYLIIFSCLLFFVENEQNNNIKG